MGNFVSPGVQLFTAMQFEVSQQSWKNRKARKLAGKEKPRGSALLCLQAEAYSFCFDGPLQIYPDRVSKDHVFQGTEFKWRVKRFAVELMIELLSLSFQSTEIWCIIITI